MHHSVDPSVPVRPQGRSPRPSRPTPRSVPGRARRSLAGSATALGIALTAVLGAPLSASAAAPTWQQVLEARGSEEAKQDALAEIAVAVEAASARAAAAEGAAEAAGQVLGDAQAAVDEASAAHEALQAEAQEARADADDARLVVGHAAALLARPGGGGGLTSELMASGGDAEQVLRGLSMSTKLGENLAAGSTGQVSRVAGRFALIAAAGELSTGWGVVPWPAGTASNAAAACFKATCSSTILARRPRVHPRASGGACFTLPKVFWREGPSPRERGSHLSLLQRQDRQGSIPARAGEPNH